MCVFFDNQGFTLLMSCQTGETDFTLELKQLVDKSIEINGQLSKYFDNGVIFYLSSKMPNIP